MLAPGGSTPGLAPRFCLLFCAHRGLCVALELMEEIVCVRTGEAGVNMWCEHVVIVTRPGAPQQATGASVA